MRIIYLNPYEKQTPGICLKIKGQVAALRTLFETEEFTIIPGRLGIIAKVLKRISREFRGLLKVTVSKGCYYRYSPVCLLLNIGLSVLSFRRRVWVEYNAIYDDELNLIAPRLKFMHRAGMFFLRRSRARHLPVTAEIGSREGLAEFTVLPNGWTVPSETGEGGGETAPETREILESVARRKREGERILIFTSGQNTAWQGLDRIMRLMTRLQNTHLVVAGPFAADDEMSTHEKTAERVTYTGMLNPAELDVLYSIADAGLGPFAVDRKALSEACPLKVREYLCAGLPAIVNYRDPLLSAGWGAGFVHFFDGDLEDLKDFISRSRERDGIAHLARRKLNWESIFKAAGVLGGNLSEDSHSHPQGHHD